MKLWRRMLSLTCLVAGAPTVLAQQLDTVFSCSALHDDQGQSVLYADSGRISIDGDRIDTFQWESALFRTTHGFDCSIDQTDGLQLEGGEPGGDGFWRITLADPLAARQRRGYDYVHGLNCSVRLQRNANELTIKPSCPALCGSRPNFSELSVNLKTGACSYQ